jgi:signal transduction histidine kinase
MDLATLIHPEDVDLDLVARADLLAGSRRSYTVDQRFLTRDGTVVWGHLSVTLLRGDDKAPRLFVIVCEDITTRVRADEERLRLSRRLQDAQRLESIGILAGGIAHDFNNILTSIQGNTDLALLSLPDDSPARVSLNQIGVAVLRATELTRQMFVYAGRRAAATPTAEVNEAIRAIGDLLRSGAARACGVRLHLSPGLPLVLAAATQVSQIVMNLVVNAAEAMGECGGEICVGTAFDELGRAALGGLVLGDEAEPGPFVRITVSDSGGGMAPDILERIFDPFFTTKLLGRGLGLASVHAIIREHHGALWVQSAPGCGTTFHIWLPVAR